MAAKTVRGSRGLRPPPERRWYFFPFGLWRRGINGATFSQRASDTSHERFAVMVRTYHGAPDVSTLFTDKLLSEIKELKIIRKAPQEDNIEFVLDIP